MRYLIPLLAAAALGLSAGTAPAAELRVAPGQDLQRVVAGARPGDVVRVAAGTYPGNLVVAVPRLTLLGEGRPTLDGRGRGNVVVVKAPGVTLRGFRIINSGTSRFRDDAGLRIERGNGCVIEDNDLTGVFNGIFLSRTRGCRVQANRVTGSGDWAKLQAWGDGIRLWNSPGNTVTANQVDRFRDGLYLEFSNDSRVEGNQVAGNSRYGLHFMFMNGSVFRHNRFHGNQVGSVLMNSKRLLIEGNTFADNRGPVGQGVMFKDNDDSLLRGNRIVNNTVGLFVEGSNRNRILDNLIAGNGWGLLLYSSSIDNVVAGNAFYANSYEVAADMRSSRNRLDDGRRGNYWSDYRGYDLDGDRLGDLPHCPVAMFSFLAMQYPDLYAFAGSPAVQALAFAQRVLPALSPSELRDAHPLMTPVVKWP